MTSLTKDTLQSVLSKIEEMALPEGEYLSLCNVLKKQFESIPDKSTPYSTTDLDRTMILRGKREIKIHITKQKKYAERREEYEYTINGVEKKGGTSDFARAVSQLMRMNLTKTILLDGEFETTFKEYKNYIEEMEREDDDDDEEWFDFNPRFVMLHMAGMTYE
jgi:hypothetical protein